MSAPPERARDITPGVRASLPFVTSLRSRHGIVRVPGAGASRITVRVEMPERWETIAFDVPTEAPVHVLMLEALAQFGLQNALPGDFVLKLRGFDVLAEQESIAASGARDGSTYLITYRRRRPVR